MCKERSKSLLKKDSPKTDDMTLTQGTDESLDDLPEVKAISTPLVALFFMITLDFFSQNHI
jgi:hypothetical protein